jgi:Spy/CpxP family protein refolding chaperone
MASCSNPRENPPPVLRALAFVAAALCAGVAAEAETTPYKWWSSRQVQMELHLTSQQVTRIDEIFESSLPTRRALRQELDALERQLDTLLDSAAVDDSAAAALITRVETARARRNIARMTMLYRIRQVLTAEQRRWFQTHALQLDGRKRERKSVP